MSNKISINLILRLEENTRDLKISNETLCNICFDHIERNDFIKRKRYHILDDHSCLEKYCTDCYVSWIERQIIDNATIIKCPTPGCKIPVEAKELRRMIRLSSKIEPFMSLINPVSNYSQNEMKEHHQFEHSYKRYCPNYDCDSFAVSSEYRGVCGSIYSKVKCKNNHEFCFNCRNNDHYPFFPYPGIHLLQKRLNQIRNEETQNSINTESKSIKWIDENTKECPRCRIPIMKNGGCAYVRCRCKTQFCWGCLNISHDHQLMTGRHNNIGCP